MCQHFSNSVWILLMWSGSNCLWLCRKVVSQFHYVLMLPGILLFTCYFLYYDFWFEGIKDLQDFLLLRPVSSSDIWPVVWLDNPCMWMFFTCLSSCIVDVHPTPRAADPGSQLFMHTYTITRIHSTQLAGRTVWRWRIWGETVLFLHPHVAAEGYAHWTAI